MEEKSIQKQIPLLENSKYDQERIEKKNERAAVFYMFTDSLVLTAAFTIMKKAYGSGFLVTDLNFLRGLIGLILISPVIYFQGLSFYTSLSA